METKAESLVDKNTNTNPEDATAAAQANLLPIAVTGASKPASGRRFIRKCTIDGGSKKVNLTAHL